MNDKIRVYEYEAFERALDRMGDKIGHFTDALHDDPDLREWLNNILEGYISDSVYNVFDLYAETCKTANIEPISFEKFDYAYQFKYITENMNFDEAALTLANIAVGWY